MSTQPPLQNNEQRLTLLQKRRSMELWRKKGNFEAQRLFYALFPDETTPWLGPPILGGLMEPMQPLFARNLYPKNLEFFRVGATHRERCAMFANRCVTPWTYLKTPAGEALSAEVWTSTNEHVLSLVGGLRCAVQPRDGLFLGIEQGFRVVLDNGQFFDCSRKHRVLTHEGWLSLDRLVSRASGLRCWHRRADYQASCDAGGYLGDQPLRSIAGIDLSLPPSRGDAQTRAPMVFEHTDEVAHRLRCTRAFQQPDRLSTLDDLRRFADLFALFSGSSSQQSVLSLRGCSRAVVLLARESGPHLQSVAAHNPDQYEDGELQASDQTEFHDESYRQTMLCAKRLSRSQWCDVQGPGGSIQEWLNDAGHIPIFYPSDSPRLVGGRTIQAVVPLGLQPIIDAHMPVTNNYFAGGVVHHNTGKTLGCGGYETACHLTGLYPKWWEGRRFSGPISAWVAGDTYETTRDIIQLNLLGEITWRKGRKHVDGHGIIPGHLLGTPIWRSGVQNVVDTIPVKHVSGGTSLLGQKSYDQGRKAFQGTGKHLIWFDEEPPMDVYNEALIRTATLNGITMLTFTPLSGLSEVVLSFLPADQRPDLAT